ncbi:glycosyltransferase [Microbacterium sp.]|uniref:glycosyltransferase n=1 Tax=Microbacterium sp. TaxID=51671 RepID=UPI003C71E5CD
MKLLVDVMGTPANSGGMNLYARELLSAWAEEFPRDDLVVVGGAWAVEQFGGYENVTVIVRRGSSIVPRAWAQLVTSGITARTRHCDALLSLSPIASPLVPRRRRAAVIHDWRHLRRPDEFGLAQRLYRTLWRWSAHSVGTAVAISQKTATETEQYAHPRRVVVVENGGDHPRRWAHADRQVSPPLVVTYGHFVNKRPEPVIDAIAQLRRTGVEVALCVLGAKGDYRERLRDAAREVGSEDAILLPGFVADDEYQRIVQRASVLVLNSSDEGFGLPVSEARYLGIPAVVANDSGLQDIHGSSVIAVAPTADALSGAIRGALDSRGDAVRPPQSWATCAAAIRKTLTPEE